MTCILKTISTALAITSIPKKEDWGYDGTQKFTTSLDQKHDVQADANKVPDDIGGLQKAVRLFNAMKITQCESVLENLITPTENIEILNTHHQSIVVKDDSYFVPFYFTAVAAAKRENPKHKRRSNERDEDLCYEEEQSEREAERNLETEPPKKKPASEQNNRPEEYYIAALQEKLPKWVKSSSNLRKNSTVFLSGPDTDLGINIANELLNLPKEEPSTAKLKEIFTKLDQSDKNTKQALGLCEEIEAMFYVYRYHFPILIKFAYAMTSELSKANKEIVSLKEKAAKSKR
ncbi:hypothetical protein MDAP_000154 [Mitosporidium daphniae]